MAWTKDDQRESQRRYTERNREKVNARHRAYRARTKEERAEKERLRGFCYRQLNKAMLAEKRKAWEAANPELRKEYAHKASRTEKTRESRRRKARRQWIALCKDKVAQQKRIKAHADAAASSVTVINQVAVTMALVKAVYSGRFPIRLTAEHAAEIMRELDMENANG